MFLPQIENELKMLYTAVTRCRDHLVFVETSKSIAGDAFFNWLQRNKLAEEFKATNDKKLLSSGEWRIRGLESMIGIHRSMSFEQVQNAVQRAINCFSNAGDLESLKLKGKAEVFKKLKQYDDVDSKFIEKCSIQEFQELIVECLEKGYIKEGNEFCKRYQKMHHKTMAGEGSMDNTFFDMLVMQKLDNCIVNYQSQQELVRKEQMERDGL